MLAIDGEHTVTSIPGVPMQCESRAILIVTREIAGTSTNVAERRVQLACALEKGHEGPHQDNSEGEEWEGAPGKAVTVLKHKKSSA